MDLHQMWINVTLLFEKLLVNKLSLSVSRAFQRIRQERCEKEVLSVGEFVLLRFN